MLPISNGAKLQSYYKIESFRKYYVNNIYLIRGWRYYNTNPTLIDWWHSLDSSDKAIICLIDEL